MTTKRNLSSMLLPAAGNDPVEAWAQRLMRSDLSLTARCIGHTIAWRALVGGNPIWFRGLDLWTATGLRPERPLERERMHSSFRSLVARGFIGLIPNIDAPAEQRVGDKPDSTAGVRLMGVPHG